MSLRVTWIQSEDLVGHELRQAREEGKDVDDVEQRWFAAGGAPAPGRGASQEPVPAELRSLALELLDELDALPRPYAEREPESFEEILAAADPSSTRTAPDLRAAIAGAWLGRAAGCVLGKPVENIPRAGIRAIARATGNWPVRGWFTAEGLPEEVSAQWPWNRASRPTSLAENIDGIPEDDDLNFTMLGVALLERCGTEFDALDVAKIWLDYMPPGRIFTAERVAVRNLLEAYLPPETATRRNPFREWIGSRLRVDAYGWAAPGDPVAAARMAWEDARVSHTAACESTISPKLRKSVLKWPITHRPTVSPADRNGLEKVEKNRAMAVTSVSSMPISRMALSIAGSAAGVFMAASVAGEAIQPFSASTA